MATSPCDHCGATAVRLVTDMETGAPSFYCLDHYGAVQTAEPVPEFRELCEQCEAEPVSMVLTQPQSGQRLQLGHRCYLVNGRVAWLMADSSEYEPLDAMAEEMLSVVPGVAKRAKGRRRKVAVDESSDSPPPVDASPEKEAEPVGATAAAGDADATNAAE